MRWTWSAKLGIFMPKKAPLTALVSVNAMPKIRNWPIMQCQKLEMQCQKLETDRFCGHTLKTWPIAIDVVSPFCWLMTGCGFLVGCCVDGHASNVLYNEKHVSEDHHIMHIIIYILYNIYIYILNHDVIYIMFYIMIHIYIICHI